MKSSFFKIYSLLTPEKRRAAMILLGFIILGTMLEVLGVGLLLPVMVIMIDDNLGSSYPVVQPLLDMLGNPDQVALVKFIMVTFVVVYLGKNLYLAFLAWWQARFSVGLQVDTGQRLFKLYLRQAYHFHLQRNSAELLRNITGEVAHFIAYAVNPMLMLVAEVLVLLSIVALLLLVEPTGSLIVFMVLSVAALLFYGLMRSRVSRWGEIRLYHEGQRIQQLQQGLGAVKDVLLLGRESGFLASFKEHNSKSGKMLQFLEVLQKIPRLWLELLAVVGVALLVLIMLSRGREISGIVPTIGLFAAAAFRLMPSVNRILEAVQSLRYGIAATNNLYDDFLLEVKDVAEDKSVREELNSGLLSREIRLNGIGYNYTDTVTPALVEVSLDIQRGESVGFIGSSGSGKSTLIDIILGLLQPGSGQVLVDGNDIRDNIRGWQDQIGYVPQSIYLTDDTMRRNIAFGLGESEIDDAAVTQAIRAAQLEDFVETLANGVETKVGERGIRLSGGQRQRIGIARALYHDPAVLDEATSALDTSTEKEVMRSIRALHGIKTVIIVAHRLSTVEHCDRLYRLDQGRIIDQGDPGDLIPASGNRANV